ncbi:unnamed protein product [Brassica napus]|uniref:(rape) hypothetical protein n=1 Tax=Brassica napus TaxID=3708 RepID=A0A816WXK9_BRANA|nr:unnamed protein product [Brassica napus]
MGNDPENKFDRNGSAINVPNHLQLIRWQKTNDSIHTFTGHRGELYAWARSPTDPTVVATGGGDDKGFLFKIGNGDWATELPRTRTRYLL